MGGHTLPTRAPPRQFWVATPIPEICRPGEGTVVEIDKIFWETKQAS
jgi:hypothetical protein